MVPGDNRPRRADPNRLAVLRPGGTEGLPFLFRSMTDPGSIFCSAFNGQSMQGNWGISWWESVLAPWSFRAEPPQAEGLGFGGLWSGGTAASLPLAHSYAALCRRLLAGAPGRTTAPALCDAIDRIWQTHLQR